MSRILIADDDIDIRDLVVLKLAAYGHDVVAVADGEQAMAEALRTDFDLLVLDVMMPRLTGFEVCARLRKDKSRGAVPVVFMTAKARESEVERGFGVGADDYIVKPFSPRELSQRVQSVLKRSA